MEKWSGTILFISKYFRMRKKDILRFSLLTCRIIDNRIEYIRYRHEGSLLTGQFINTFICITNKTTDYSYQWNSLAIWFWPHGMSGLVGSGRWLQTWQRGFPPLVLQFPVVLRHLPRLNSTQMSSLKRRGSMLYLMLGGIVVGHCCCWNCCC